MLKRFLSLYIFFIFCFMVLLGRIYYIAKKDYTTVMTRQSTRTITVGEKRGEIYDRNFSPLVNTENKLLAVVTPCVGSYEYLKGKIDEAYLNEKIKNASPFITEVDEEINNEFIRTFSVPVRYTDEQTATHLIGYTDNSGKSGVTGIEKAFNSYLTENSGKLTVSFQVDAVGRVLAGMDKYIDDKGFSSKAGIVLTIDKTIQSIAEKALKNSKIKSGAVIVMKAHTGEIYALASVPSYNPTNVADSLLAENSPFVNKALTSYSIGSIFKPLVAAAALENNISTELIYECKGEIKIGDSIFKCYNNKSHGKINMQDALSVSCNTYFINLISKVDVDFLLKLCKDTGLGSRFTLAPGLGSSAGVLPTRESLNIKGNLANFAFGQGDLLASPLQIASVYHTLATGNFLAPRLVLGFTNYMGLMTKIPSEGAIKLLSDKTVNKLQQLLSVSAKNNGCNQSLFKIAGKTGTAQSGVYLDSKEILRTWFAGFFPAENPNYVVVILNENGSSGYADCSPVFREIAENIVLR
jgi:penicillin-binding protein 2